jgi:hypothetical protein
LTNCRRLASSEGRRRISPALPCFLTSYNCIRCYSSATVHRFKAVASTSLNEMGFNPDWIVRQLIHDERNKVRDACNADQYLPDRRRMMNHWADFLDEVAAIGSVTISRRKEAA